MQEKMTASKIVYLERLLGVPPPTGQVFSGSMGILIAAKDRDWAGQWRILMVKIGLCQLKISAQGGQHQLQDGLVGGKLLRDGIAGLAQRLHDLRIRQLRKVGLWLRKLWRTAGRDQQVRRQGQITLA
jgi:hypothetical protein